MTADLRSYVIVAFDAVWLEAEAALPEGWTLSLCDSVGHPDGKYEAAAYPPRRGDPTWVCADTPSAALYALAVRLRELP